MIFKEAKTTDFTTYKPFFTNQRYALSGYALSSLISWSNSIFTTSFALYNDALIVAGKLHTSHKNEINDYLILPISPKGDFTPELLRDVLLQSEKMWCLLVPDSYINTYGLDNIEKLFDVFPHEDYDDYIYHHTDLCELKGNKYSKKRNLINQFIKSYVDKDRVRIENIHGGNKDECLDFLEQWCTSRDCNKEINEILLCEKNAIIKTLEHLEYFELRGLLLRIDGVVSAFAVASSLTSDVGVLQYEKADAEIKGLYQYFDKMCAEKLFKGYPFINKESDMGIEGLKRAKRSYHPCMMIKSFKLRLKSSYQIKEN